MQVLPWWAYVLQGSGGAFLGLIGVVSVFMLTRRHDRQRDQRAREVEAEKLRNERTATSVSDVLDATLLYRAKGDLDALVHALVKFSVREAADHPEAAHWASDLVGVLADYRQQGKQDSIVWEAGYLTSTLAGWVQERYSPGIFARVAPKLNARRQAAL